MSPNFAQMTISNAIFACSFALLSAIGFGGHVSASCGDYLRHHPGTLSSRLSMNVAHEGGQPGKMPAPTTGCKNGNCGEAPPALPFNSATMAKLEANHFNSVFFLVFGSTDKLKSSDEKSPLQPTLELADPPPRTLAL